MKRFRKLERAREAADGEAQPETAVGAPKRFEAIERPTGARSAAADPFAPTADPEQNVQLDLHDRYSEHVEDARRTRQARATEQLAQVEARRAALDVPHRAPGVLDALTRGLAIGPLARLGTETRFWLLGATLLATWLGLALALGVVAAMVGVAVLAGALLALGLRPR